MRIAQSILCLGLFITATPAFSQISSHQQAAFDVLDAMGMETQMTKTMEAMMGPMLGGLGNQAPEGMAEALLGFFEEILVWDELKPQFAQVYVDLFTEDELRELEAFYGTAIGRRLMEQTPQISAGGAAVTQAVMAENQGKMMELMTQLMQGNRTKQ